jgi:hypothetical protein
VAVTASPVPAVRRSKRYCGSWKRYDRGHDPDMTRI